MLSPNSRSRSILFRCDGSSQIGLGHVIRCLALADEFRESYNFRIFFAMRQSPIAYKMVQQRGYPVFIPQDDERSFDYPQWFEEIISNVAAQIVLLDVRDDLPRVAVDRLRQKGVLIATLDDPSERRLAADLAFYPPVPQLQRLNWDGFTGQLYVGWEWVVLRREFSNPPPRQFNNPPVVLVTMGGSDPAAMTLKGIEALTLLKEDFETIVVLGPAFSHFKAMRELLSKTDRRFELRRNVTDMSYLMAQTDLAVASFGVTAYELAAVGVPAIYLCLTQDHAESALTFVEANIAVSLGVFFHVTDQSLAEETKALLNNTSKRLYMADQAKKCLCGDGAKQIVKIIASKIK